MENKRSKLAVTSFILSLIPFVASVTIFSWMFLVEQPLNPQLKDLINIFINLYFYVSIFTFWISLIAIMMGVVAFKKIKINQLKGRGFAVWAIIFGGVVVATFVLYIVFFALALEGLAG